MQIDLDRVGAVPIYTQLKEWMRRQIASGAWPRGYKLTAEAELADALDLARGTVRRAIEDLTAEGLLIRTHGRGTFVAPPPVDQPLAERLVTYSEALLAQGIAFTTDVLDARFLPAPDAIAQAMECPPGTRLFALRRVRRIEGAPVTLLHNVVLASRCPGIERFDFTRLRLFEVLEGAYGLRLQRGRRFFQALNADEETAAALDIDPGTAVMLLVQTTYESDGHAVEHSSVWLRGSSFRLSASLQRGAEAGLDIQVVAPASGADGPHAS